MNSMLPYTFCLASLGRDDMMMMICIFRSLHKKMIITFYQSVALDQYGCEEENRVVI